MKHLVDVVRDRDGEVLASYEIEAETQREAGTIAMVRFTDERPLQSEPTIRVHFRPQ